MLPSASTMAPAPGVNPAAFWKTCERAESLRTPGFFGVAVGGEGNSWSGVCSVRKRGTRPEPVWMSVVAQANASHAHWWKTQSGVLAAAVSVVGNAAAGLFTYPANSSIHPMNGQD